MITVEQDRFGHIQIDGDGEKSCYYQFETDLSAVSDLLTQQELEDLNAGWTVKIEEDEPRASCFGEMLELGKQHAERSMFPNN